MQQCTTITTTATIVKRHNFDKNNSPFNYIYYAQENISSMSFYSIMCVALLEVILDLEVISFITDDCYVQSPNILY
jgi:hypothetical protein